MPNLNKRADLIDEVKQLREDLSLLNKVVVSNRRLIAFLEYTRTSASWTVVPNQGGSFKGESLGTQSHGVRTRTPGEFQLVPYRYLSEHILSTMII
jgi:hypothetical protein